MYMKITPKNYDYDKVRRFISNQNYKTVKLDKNLYFLCFADNACENIRQDLYTGKYILESWVNDEGNTFKQDVAFTIK